MPVAQVPSEWRNAEHSHAIASALATRITGTCTALRPLSRKDLGRRPGHEHGRRVAGPFELEVAAGEVGQDPFARCGR